MTAGKVSRRSVLKLMGATAAGLAAGRLQSSTVWQPVAALAAPESALPYEGVELTVVSTVGPFTSGPIKAHAPDWTVLTGGTIKLIEYPFGELFEKIMSSFVGGVEAFDIVHFGADYVGDIAGSGYVLPLDEFLAKDERMAWDDFLPTYRKWASWNGKTYAIPSDGDNHILYYRKDIIANADNQAKFKAKYGYDLAAPATWEQYKDVAEFFTGWDWASDGKTHYGTLEYMARNGQTQWAILSRTAPYVCLPPDHAAYVPGALFFNAEDMTPYVNSPGHVRALEMFVKMIPLGAPGMKGYAAGEVRGGFVAGEGAMALDWGDIGTMAEDKKNSRVIGKIGYSVLPGTKEVWSHKTQAWVPMPEVNRAPFLAFGGWMFAISKSSKHPDAAYDFLSYLQSPDVSLKDVASGATGDSPYRATHFSRLDAWKEIWTDDPKPYLDAIQATINHPNVQLDLHIPGAFRYFDALDLNVNRALNGEVSAQKALDDAASEWTQITDELGKDKQLTSYRASLGLPSE